jgi:hypothetical protein
MTNQKTTRAGYGHPGLQSIDIHALSSKAKSCARRSLPQLLSIKEIRLKDKSIQEHETFLVKDAELGLKRTIDFNHRDRTVLRKWILLEIPLACDCNF